VFISGIFLDCLLIFTDVWPVWKSSNLYQEENVNTNGGRRGETLSENSDSDKENNYRDYGCRVELTSAVEKKNGILERRFFCCWSRHTCSDCTECVRRTTYTSLNTLGYNQAWYRSIHKSDDFYQFHEGYFL